jgi:hypothetical protein
MLQHTPLGFRIPYGFKSHTCMYVSLPCCLINSTGQLAYLLAEYIDVHSVQKIKKNWLLGLVVVVLDRTLVFWFIDTDSLVPSWV